MTKNLFTIIFTLAFLSVTFCSAQIPDSILSHIDSSLGILENNSLYASKVDWAQVKKQVYQKASLAKTKAGTFEALKIAFNALGDKHAAYYQYDDEYKIPDSLLLARFTDSIKNEWAKGPRVVNKMIGEIAYLNIPFMGVNTQKSIDEQANLIYDAVIKLQHQNPRCWIIDLRVNSGGNIRPMLAGVAMFFNDGIVSYYIDRNGIAADEGSFKDGNFQIDNMVQATIKAERLHLQTAKVAVLIGPGTASSGEGVAAVFKQRPNTKLIGESSAGRANSTNGFVFNNNLSYFLISTAFLGDKNKKQLPETVVPDIVVKNNDAFNDLLNDNAVKEAIH